MIETQVKVLQRTKNELKIEIIGEDHTFCNLLQNVLLQDKNVEIAGYDQPHPLIRSSIVHLKTKRDVSPERAMILALTSIRDLNKDFNEKFERAVGPP